jgi:hypothetical protein
MGAMASGWGAPRSSVTKYQSTLARGIERLFGELPVATEWAAMRGERAIYSPRLDVAVGPFATDDILASEYDALVTRHAGFLQALFELHCQNLRLHEVDERHFDFHHACHRNYNARCFIAFEIENVVSRKHLMGGAINAAALGRLGVAIGWDRGKVRALVRLRSYLLFLASVGKNTFDPSNLLILSAEQALEVVEIHLARVQR